MTALGRILQVVGWLWVLAGFASRFVDIPSFSVFPGFILIFVARMIRTQAARREMPDLPKAEPVESTAAPPPERQLNTERQQQAKQQPVQQKTVPEPKPAATARPTPDPESVERDDLLERIALAGQSKAASSVSTDTADFPDPAKKPKTSAEMIAEARKRWDSKKRSHH